MGFDGAGGVAEERPLRLPFLRPGQRKLASASCKRCNIRRIIPQRHKAEKSALPPSVGIFPARPPPQFSDGSNPVIGSGGRARGSRFFSSAGFLSSAAAAGHRCHHVGAGGSHTRLMTAHFLKLFPGRFRCDLGKAEGLCFVVFFSFSPHAGFEAASSSLSCGHTGSAEQRAEC